MNATRENIITTRNSWCAAAMASLHQEFCGQSPITVYKDGAKEFCSFNFKDTPMARRIFAAFENEKNFIQANPNDPITGFLLFRHNYQRIIDVTKQVPRRVITQQNGKIYLTLDK